MCAGFRPFLPVLAVALAAVVSPAREPEGGITELSFTPGARRSLQLGLAWLF